MSYQNEAYVFGATVVTLGTIGASVFPTKISPPPGSVGGQMKLLGAAGSTVQVLANQISGLAGGIAGLTTIGASVAGYPLNAVGVDNSIYTGPASFWLAATGATATVAITFRFSASGTPLT